MITWRLAWEELGAPADHDLYLRLKAAWSEPHRHYHTLTHLSECIHHFEAIRPQAHRPAEIMLGLWFHDAVYDPARKDNEERSAQWARESVLAAGLPAEVAGRIHALVMSTQHDVSRPTDSDAQLLVDIDLSILGADDARFDESSQQVRQEYAHVPEADYRIGRSNILHGFLERPRLYHTGYFHDRLESRARENLRRALEALSPPPSGEG